MIECDDKMSKSEMITFIILLVLLVFCVRMAWKLYLEDCIVERAIRVKIIERVIEESDVSPEEVSKILEV